MQLVFMLFVEAVLPDAELPPIDEHYKWVQVPTEALAGADAYAALSRLLRAHRPATLITTTSILPTPCGATLARLPYVWRRRWINAATVAEIQWQQAVFCHVHACTTAPPAAAPPLFSIVTSTWRSGDKIQRPWQALTAQAHRNWEWVVWDDTEAGNDDTWQRLLAFRDCDIRVRCYRDTDNSGFIGDMKWRAAALCRGDWLVEVDHDDTLHPQLLEFCADAIRAHPEVDFIYSDVAELHEGSEAPFSYGDFFGFGYCAYEKQWHRGRWHNVAMNACGMNAKTARHIVGVPNHVRIWRRSFYERIGRHVVELPVADDYELLLRSFFEGRWLRLACCGYFQYRNAGADNFTFRRNSLIQHLVAHTRAHHEARIAARLAELGILDTPAVRAAPHVKAWEAVTTPPAPGGSVRTAAHAVYLPGVDLATAVSAVIVAPTHATTAQLCTSVQSVLAARSVPALLYIVGEACAALPGAMAPGTGEVMALLTAANMVDGARTRWWNLENAAPYGAAYARTMLVLTEHAQYLQAGEVLTADPT